MISIPTTGDAEGDLQNEERPGVGGRPSVSLSELLFTATPRAPSGMARTEELPLELDAGEISDITVAGQADGGGVEETSTVFSLFGSLFQSTDPIEETPRSGRVLFTNAPNIEPPTTTERVWSRDERSWSDVFLSNLQGRRGANRRLQRDGTQPQPINMNASFKMPVNLSPRRRGVNFKKVKVPANGRWRLRHWG